MKIDNSSIEKIKKITVEAGEILRNDYLNSSLKVKFKEDDSLLTDSDLKAHHYIQKELKKNFSWPVVSEEEIHFSPDSLPECYYLVDPLDGTKEFLSGSGEFTVNIALMVNKKPSLGFIYSPMSFELYWGGKNYGSFKESHKESQKKVLHGKRVDSERLTLLISYTYNTKIISLLRENFPQCKIKRYGSSLKLCLLAEGKADGYFRRGPTCEWDIAAGHSILEGAGGKLTGSKGEEFRYCKKDYLNPAFIAVSEAGFDTSKVQKIMNLKF